MADVQNIITDSLVFLRDAINAAISNINSESTGTHIVLGNAAIADDGVADNTGPLEDTLLLSLFKVEEEFALKNKPAHRRNPATGQIEKIAPPSYLNLHVLVTARNNNYETALTKLSQLIGYLRYQTVFDNRTATTPDMDVPRFRFNLSMVTLSYEQLNHIWGIMGGKHYPCVMYKLQLVEIQYEPDNPDSALPIEEIHLQEKIY